MEAQHRWLRPTEICEILQNYRKFRIAPEPSQRPPSGSLFLFDRKVLRYFRKDGHNWRKKKDGKTIKEAHERLKADSVDVLHCYYAHGEENENFQRRTYWMLEEALMHIVLVHYLEVKGSKTSFSRARDDGEIASVTRMDSSYCTNSSTSQNNLHSSQTMETGSPSSTQTSDYADTESADYHQGRSRYHPFPELQQHVEGSLTDAILSNHNVALPSGSNQLLPDKANSGYYSVPQESTTKEYYEADRDLQFNRSKTVFSGTSWEEVIRNGNAGFESVFEASATGPGKIPYQDDLEFRELLTNELISKQKDAQGNDKEESLVNYSQLLDSEDSPVLCRTTLENDHSLHGKRNSVSLLKDASLDLSNIHGDGLKKHDSFSRWMSKELREVDDSNMKSSSQSCWNFIGSELPEDASMTTAEHLDSYIMSPSVSQDQLFSILDFSPNWAYTGFKTKVLITGTFLKDKKDLEFCKWSCMFGEVEVPAEIIADGVLRCDAPSHKPGTVPFYITCSNRFACSEVREFEFQDPHSQCMDTLDSQCGEINELHLHIRFGKLLSLGSLDYSTPVNMTDEKLNLCYEISSFFMEADDEWCDTLERTNDEELNKDSLKDHIFQKLLKQQLHDWLLRKISEGGKGPCVLDKDGQGVLHLAAAIGYEWAIRPTVTAGVGLNFRDALGWTALHWAAFCGRERTVVSLVTLGAAPGVLTDPTPEFPSGRTPADLASANGHKGIAGFLAESTLTAQLETLTFKDVGRGKIFEAVSSKDIEEFAKYDEDAPDEPSMKDSFSAVRNATVIAARIHQVFRVQSFQRKKLVQYSKEMSRMSDVQDFSFISFKANKPGQHDAPAHFAAIRIQNKFRGWKRRKEFLLIRQRIVKIQAYVRGHQVRKRYKKIVWTVGIIEKVILRWRRKGSGLRGFRSEGVLEASSNQNAQHPNEDEYDFLQEGRKQTELRMQKALARVKSMVQYPEARDQYRRLLDVVSELQDSKAVQDRVSDEVEDADAGDFMMEFEELWEVPNIPAWYSSDTRGEPSSHLSI
ncbi:Calmodulin-binding transcription activator 3 [Platanthera guangdongensis]|uniref:Calmodulin-binding transcription activator 3 n=1 Tax=Platanthera guangdongensis TaxID=2320717 RepID=A0ABR2LHU8_9ASPA